MVDIGALEKQLKALFKKEQYKENTTLYEIIQRGYLYSKIQESKKILFVGINPSYVNGATPNDEKFYDVQDAVKGYKKHYGKFQTIADNCDFAFDWTYLDIFYFRETAQTTIDLFLNDSESLNFIVAQLQLTISQLENLKPDLIIVCNSGARKFFGADKQISNNNTYTNVWMGYEFLFDEKFGVEVITGINEHSVKIGTKKTNLIGTPVIFTSTLTYMDSSTKKRLEWQIKTILKHKDVFFGEQNFSDQHSEKLLNQLTSLTSKLIEIKNQKSNLLSQDKTEQLQELADVVELIESLRLYTEN